MRILFTLFSLIFFCTSQIAFPAGTISMSYPVPTTGIEVTSPYGWRIHPSKRSLLCRSAAISESSLAVRISGSMVFSSSL